MKFLEGLVLFSLLLQILESIHSFVVFLFSYLVSILFGNVLRLDENRLFVPSGLNIIFSILSCDGLFARLLEIYLFFTHVIFGVFLKLI